MKTFFGKFFVSFLILMALLAIPTVVFAYHQTISTTVFYACEANDGSVDASTITQDDTLTCPVVANSVYVNKVQWNVKGDKGDQGVPGTPGTNGTNGSNVLTSSGVPSGACTSGDSDIDLSNGEVYSCVSSAWTDTGHTVKGAKGDTGAQGPAGPNIESAHAACTETGLTGSAQQENLIFCQSGIEPDSSTVYTAAINAAKVHIIVGTPIAAFQSVDWGGTALTYVEFTSGLHAEYHADNKVRFFNAANQQVF